MKNAKWTLAHLVAIGTLTIALIIFVSSLLPLHFENENNQTNSITELNNYENDLIIQNNENQEERLIEYPNGTIIYTEYNYPD